MARLPQPPLGRSNADLSKSITDIINYLRQTWENGSAINGFTQDQIDTFTDLSFLGKFVYNTTTNEVNVSYLDAGALKWRAV